MVIKVDASLLNLEERRGLLQGYLEKGRIASLEWTKKDGSVTKRTVQLWRENALTFGKEFVQANPTSHKPELFTCYETEGKWCNVSLDRLISARMGGVDYEF